MVARLQMGIKNASAVFQRCMEHILKGIPGVVVYQDDVMICAANESQFWQTSEHRQFVQTLLLQQAHGYSRREDHGSS